MQQQPSGLERLLPTIGNVGGTILGGIGGALVPGADLTGVPEVAGGAAGGAAGQAAGKWLENALTGAPQGQGVAKNAAIGGITSGIGGGIGLGVGKLAGGLFGAGTDAASGGIGSKIGGMFKGAAQGLMQKNLMQADDPAGLAKYFLDHGVTDPGHVGSVTDELTTGFNAERPGILTNATQSALKSQSGGSAEDPTAQRLVDLDPIHQEVDTLLRGTPKNPSASMITGPTAERAGGTIENMFKSGIPESSLKNPDGTFMSNAGPYTTTPDKAYGVYQQLRDAAYGMGYPKQGTPAAGLQNTYKTLAGSVKDAIFGPNGELMPLSDEEKQSVIGQIDKSIAPINSTAATSLKNDVANATSHLDLNNIQTNWIAGKNAVLQGNKLASQSGGETVASLLGKVAPLAGLATAGPAGAIVGGGVLAGTTDAGHAATTSILNNLGNKLSGTGPMVDSATQKTIGKVLPLLTRAGAVAGGTAGGVSQAEAGQTNTGTQAPQGGSVNPYETQGIPSNDIMQQINLAGLFGNTGAIPVLQQSLRAESAQPLLGGLESSYGAAGGGQGALGGTLSNILSLIPGTAAYQYKQQQDQTAQALASILGVKPEAIASPSFMASQPGAQNSFSQLQAALAALQQPGAALNQNVAASLPAPQPQ